MQNPLPKLRQRSIISKKPGLFSERLKTLRGSNYRRIQYFLVKFSENQSQRVHVLLRFFWLPEENE